MTAPWPYPAPADDGAASHLVVGLPLPDVALPATGGGAVNLAHAGGLAVVFVYPWTGRPGLADPPGWDTIPGAHGSTPEAEGFRDHHADFRALGATVYGFSTQDGEHQRELVQRLRLPFEILSDSDLAFAGALRLPSFAIDGVTYLKRLTLIVRDGRIAHTFYPVHPPAAHAAEVLAFLQSRGA